MRHFIYILFLCAALSFFLHGSAYAAEDLAVSNAWALPSLKGVSVGSAYITIANEGAEEDVMIGATSPVAEHVEIHSHQMSGDIIKMLKHSSLAVPAGKTVVFQPGGYHLMLISLKKPLEKGKRFPVTLEFKRAGRIQVDVAVQRNAP